MGTDSNFFGGNTELIVTNLHAVGKPDRGGADLDALTRALGQLGRLGLD